MLLFVPPPVKSAAGHIPVIRQELFRIWWIERNDLLYDQNSQVVELDKSCWKNGCN